MEEVEPTVAIWYVSFRVRENHCGTGAEGPDTLRFLAPIQLTRPVSVDHFSSHSCGYWRVYDFGHRGWYDEGSPWDVFEPQSTLVKAKDSESALGKKLFASSLPMTTTSTIQALRKSEDEEEMRRCPSHIAVFACRCTVCWLTDRQVFRPPRRVQWIHHFLANSPRV